MVETMRAQAKNIPTATNDLLLSLDNPHNPCPLVHPLPNLVPKPTNRPARAYPK